MVRCHAMQQSSNGVWAQETPALGPEEGPRRKGRN